MKKFILTVIGLCVTFIAYSQTIKAIIVDSEDNTTLPLASVHILKPDSTLFVSFSSDKDGKLEEAINLNTFIIQVKYIGYSDCFLLINKDHNKNIDLGRIEIHSNSTALEGVTISASARVNSMNKAISYPTLPQLKASGNGIELLKNLNLPGLFVDPISQTVSVSGANQVIYKINGRTVTQQEILTIKPECILRVECANSSSTRYANQNAAIIDVILKKVDNGTYIFTDFLSAFSTGFINGNTMVKSVLGKSEFTVNYGINWRDYDERWGYESETYHFPKETFTWIREVNKAPFGYTFQNVNIGYTFNDRKNVFNVKLSDDIFSRYEDRNIDVKRINQSADDLNRIIRTEDKSHTPSLDLFYNHKFNEDQGLELNMVGTFITTDYLRNLTDRYIHQQNKESVVRSVTDGNKKSLIFEGLYYSKLSKMSYSLGLRGNYSYTKNIYDHRDKSTLKLFDLYPYAELKGRIKLLDYSIGSGLKILTTNNNKQTKSYYRNLTTLSLFYNSNKYWNVMYNFTYSPSYPSLADLTNIDQRLDSLTVFRGNPNIKPSQTINNRLTFAYNTNKINLSTAIYGQKTFDEINDELFYEAASNSLIIQKQNLLHTSAFGASLEGVLPSLLGHFTLRFGAYWDKYTTKGEGYKYSFDHFYWLAVLSSQYKNFTLDIGYKKPQKQMSGRYIYLNENYSMVNLNYKIKNLTLKTGVYYPFTSGTKYGNNRLSDIANLKSVRYISDNANMFYVGFTYNVNWGKSIFNINKSINNSDRDNGILKAQDN